MNAPKQIKILFSKNLEFISQFFLNAVKILKFKYTNLLACASIIFIIFKNLKNLAWAKIQCSLHDVVVNFTLHENHNIKYC